MQEFNTFSSPVLNAAVWRGALLWAIAIYIPLSAPLTRLEASLDASRIPPLWRQTALIISSLLLAMAVGLLAQLLASWALGPGWASSMALIAIGWSLFLIAADREGEREE